MNHEGTTQSYHMVWPVHRRCPVAYRPEPGRCSQPSPSCGSSRACALAWVPAVSWTPRETATAHTGPRKHRCRRPHEGPSGPHRACSADVSCPSYARVRKGISHILVWEASPVFSFFWTGWPWPLRRDASLTRRRRASGAPRRARSRVQTKAQGRARTWGWWILRPRPAGRGRGVGGMGVSFALGAGCWGPARPSERPGWARAMRRGHEIVLRGQLPERL